MVVVVVVVVVGKTNKKKKVVWGVWGWVYQSQLREFSAKIATGLRAILALY